MVVFSLIACTVVDRQVKETSILENKNTTAADSFSGKPSIHIFVALCDNEYQGIVKVPENIGKGDKPSTNLYWGCGYGVKTYFKKSAEWLYIKTIPLKHANYPDTLILERLMFKHKSSGQYLIADAYNGKYIQPCIKDFLKSTSGQMKDTLHYKNDVIGIQGNARLCAYIGHDGLMEFDIEDTIFNADGKTRDCIILACISKGYFAPYIQKAKGNPLVWTTGFMSPEAYTIHDALSSYLKNQSKETIRNSAAAAYSRYHKSCSINASRKLLVSGF